MEPMNVSVYSCADTSLGCSCGDCPLSPACSNIEPPSPSKEDACSIKIGPLKVGVDAIQINSICLVLFWFCLVHILPKFWFLVANHSNYLLIDPDVF